MLIRQKNTNTEDYFSGRNIWFGFVVGASIFASKNGIWYVVGLAGNGAGDKMPLLICQVAFRIVRWMGIFLPFYAKQRSSLCRNFWA
jgi:SSS family solute:Na+ symporter